VIQDQTTECLAFLFILHDRPNLWTCRTIMSRLPTHRTHVVGRCGRTQVPTATRTFSVLHETGQNKGILSRSAILFQVEELGGFCGQTNLIFCQDRELPRSRKASLLRVSALVYTYTVSWIVGNRIWSSVRIFLGSVARTPGLRMLG
jgi:hypothetical protein